jgi:hypothetical protein
MGWTPARGMCGRSLSGRAMHKRTAVTSRSLLGAAKRVRRIGACLMTAPDPRRGHDRARACLNFQDTPFRPASPKDSRAAQNPGRGLALAPIRVRCVILALNTMCLTCDPSGPVIRSRMPTAWHGQGPCRALTWLRRSILSAAEASILLAAPCRINIHAALAAPFMIADSFGHYSARTVHDHGSPIAPARNPGVIMQAGE